MSWSNVDHLIVVFIFDILNCFIDKAPFFLGESNFHSSIFFSLYKRFCGPTDNNNLWFYQKFSNMWSNSNIAISFPGRLKYMFMKLLAIGAGCSKINPKC